ncbi:hypothetical protein PVAP13_1NG143400, partial [Panicum virgatum]
GSLSLPSLPLIRGQRPTCRVRRRRRHDEHIRSISYSNKAYEHIRSISCTNKVYVMFSNNTSADESYHTGPHSELSQENQNVEVLLMDILNQMRNLRTLLLTLQRTGPNHLPTPEIGRKQLSLVYADIMKKLHYFECWGADEFRKVNRCQDSVSEDIKEINFTTYTIERTLIKIQMNEISNAVQDHRISKLISSFAGRPPKPYEEKASKFYQYDCTLSE